MNIRDFATSAGSSRRRAGFTLIELLIVILITGAILSFAIPNLTKTTATRYSRNARDAFVWGAQRARARAIQTGTTQLFELDPATERAWVVRRGSTDTLYTVNFQTEHESTVSTASNAVITVCFNPRGFATVSCNVNVGSNVDVTFTHGGYTSAARVKPLGQVERL